MVDSGTHPIDAYLASLAEGSRRSMLSALRTFATPEDPYRMSWTALRRERVVAYRDHAVETLAPATVNKILAAVKGVAAVALAPEHCVSILGVRGVRNVRAPAGRRRSSRTARARPTKRCAIERYSHSCALRAAVAPKSRGSIWVTLTA